MKQMHIEALNQAKFSYSKTFSHILMLFSLSTPFFPQLRKIYKCFLYHKIWILHTKFTFIFTK